SRLSLERTVDLFQTHKTSCAVRRVCHEILELSFCFKVARIGECGEDARQLAPVSQFRICLFVPALDRKCGCCLHSVASLTNLLLYKEYNRTFVLESNAYYVSTPIQSSPAACS